MYKPARIWGFNLFRAWEFSAFLIAGYFAMHLSQSELSAGISIEGGIFWYLGLVFACGGVLWVCWLSQSDLYASRRLIKRKNELLQIFLGAICAAGLLSFLGTFSHLPTTNPDFLAGFAFGIFFLTAMGRVTVRTLQRIARTRKRNQRHVAIVGNGAPVQNLIQQILKNTNSGIVIDGVFGSTKGSRSLPEGAPFGGNLDELSDRMMCKPLDEVLVTLSITEHYDDVRGLIDRCRRVGVPVRVIDERLAPFGMRPKIEHVAGSASLVYEDTPDWGRRGQIKDLFDIFISVSALIMLLPVFLIVAIAIKLDSPGPVFFVQPRVGRNRVTFPFYKFRTMQKNAAAIQATLETQNESAGPVFKIAKDPRITRVGAFLRKYSIDELPQFLNVLKGEMSIVGPRPLPLRDVERFEADWHSRRFSVKPGLTCSWVIAGRSELTFDQWVQMDLAYIDNWSLRKDAKIIMNTIPAVFRGSGAY